jgi:hypothetical protein
MGEKMVERIRLRDDTSKPKKPSHVKFTKPFLDNLLKQKPAKQVMLWDSKQTGLCVLHSPGQKHKAESTVTFSACYYLPTLPGKPKYTKLGRYGEKTFYRNIDGMPQTLDCGNIEAVRLRCSEIRNAAKIGMDPTRPSVSGGAKVGQWSGGVVLARGGVITGHWLG